MSDIKNVSIIEESKQTKGGYLPTEKEKEVLTAVIDKFRTCQSDRDRNFQYFDGLNLVEYIEDSVKRFFTNVDEREGIEDWQARVNNPFTRNKVLAILGKVIQILPIAQARARGEDDYRKAEILSSLYEYAEDIDDYDELMVCALLECIVKGTFIGYEGMERKTKLRRDVRKTGDDITVHNKEETTTRLFGSIVPLEDFYPASVGIRNVKAQPYVFWRQTLPYQKFLMDYGMYEKSKCVMPYSSSLAKENRPFYSDFISDTTPEGSVEILRYYNADVDEFIMEANGIWLNPITTSDGEEIISPLPFNHKELPFWDCKFDLFGADFFYGKSLPDRLKSLQDILNVLTNMLLDQSFMTIFPPLLTNGFDSIEDDYLRPGRRTPIDTQGLPINQAYMQLNMSTPSGWHQYILEYTQKIMEQSSLDQVSSGQAGVGGRTTAQEIRLAAEGVTSMLGVFARMINVGVKRKAMLKMGNILQFWTDQHSPMKSVTGDEPKDIFNIFKIDNTKLSSGKRGVKIVEFLREGAPKPKKMKLKARAALAKMDSGKEVEIVVIEPQYIRNLEKDIKLVPNQKSETTKDIDKALQLEKVRVYLSFFPNQVDMDELSAETAIKMGDDPTKIFKSEMFNPKQEGNPEAMSPMGTAPQGAEANNAVRGMMGGEQDAMQMRDLQNSMTG